MKRIFCYVIVILVAIALLYYFFLMPAEEAPVEITHTITPLPAEVIKPLPLPNIKEEEEVDNSLLPPNIDNSVIEEDTLNTVSTSVTEKGWMTVWCDYKEADRLYKEEGFGFIGMDGKLYMMRKYVGGWTETSCSK